MIKIFGNKVGNRCFEEIGLIADSFNYAMDAVKAKGNDWWSLPFGYCAFRGLELGVAVFVGTLGHAVDALLGFGV